jgi:pimeloyl-ACP methyl ester carboxylesterase
LDQDGLQFLTLGHGADERRIAVKAEPGRQPGLFWLSGFKSDMSGSKAEALAAHARARGQAVTRMDYSGHGLSGGAFEDGTISRWLEEALAVFDHCTQGPQVLIGSSMGGWLALLLTLAHRRSVPASGKPSRIRGLVLIAPATDFTEELIWKTRLDKEGRERLMREGRIERPSAYGDGPYAITRRLIEDGRNHLLLDKRIATGCPVTILQGREDPDVPWRHASRLAEALAEDDVTFTLIPDGDHRLSRPQDVQLLLQAVDRLSGLKA